MRGKKEKELRWLWTKNHIERSYKREKKKKNQEKIENYREILIQEVNNIKV